MTIRGNDFWEFLISRDYTFFAGVPDSTFGPAYNALTSNPYLTYVPATREDSAIGVASAAYFSGEKGGVVMQNSGLGNVINPLTSFNLMYEIPVLFLFMTFDNCSTCVKINSLDGDIHFPFFIDPGLFFLVLESSGCPQ